MFGFLLRTLWRLIIFAIGLGCIWAAVAVFPYADARFPLFIILFFTYCLFVYVIIPLLVRLLRMVIKPERIPLYVTTRDGWPSDPVNIALIVSNRTHLMQAMEAAGWHTADKLTLRTSVRELLSIAFNTSYPKAPLSHLYLFGRPHDVGFEIPTNGAESARTRHHVRFWRLQAPSIHKNDTHYQFWEQKLKHLLHLEKELWIGAATEETHPIDIQWFSGQLTHGGSHDSDRERDFIITSLHEARQSKSIHTTEPGDKIKFRGQQFRTFYITDGSIKVVKLRQEDSHY